MDYRAELCAKRAQSDPEATPAVLGDWNINRSPNGDDHARQFGPLKKWPFWIGMGGRFPVGISGRFHRNAQKAMDFEIEAIYKLIANSSLECLKGILEAESKGVEGAPAEEPGLRRDPGPEKPPLVSS